MQQKPKITSVFRLGVKVSSRSLQSVFERGVASRLFIQFTRPEFEIWRMRYWMTLQYGFYSSYHIVHLEEPWKGAYC